MECFKFTNFSAVANLCESEWVKYVEQVIEWLYSSELLKLEEQNGKLIYKSVEMSICLFVYWEVAKLAKSNKINCGR